MENIELKFYWYPNNDTNGVNFEKDKEYVIADINSILLEKKSRKINGFFIHFGIPVADDRFNRIIIERGTENIFKVKEQMFFKNNYLNDHTSPIVELAFKPIVDYLEIISKNNRSDSSKGSGMLNRFGALGSE
jgi:hypothetical protein